MLALKKKRVIKQSSSIKSVKKPTIIEATPKIRKVIKKGGCCGRSSS
jgi:hypothetical protein